MNKLFCYFLILLFSTRAYADAGVSIPDAQVPKNEAPVGSVIVPINKTVPAPFSGVLFSPTSVAWVITEFKNADQKTKIEVNKAVSESNAKSTFLYKEADAKCVADKKVLGAKIESQTSDILFLNDKIKAAESANSMMPVYVGLGATGGILLTLLTVWAVSAAVK